ncbi:MAG: hypothetical protein A2Y77_12860 [Planctomycetes bacterium RBG_13_62_9]|nr:MAG: hypothetical protein A2Y77_12860 [Planctomycetes bacterium RBG_13_62_9]
MDGRPLWFESADVPLRPAPEAFGSAMLPAAVERKADLVLGQPVDPRWHTGVMALQDVWNAWWKYRKVSVRSSAGQDGDGTRASGVALCFSGGVDSFFSLLRGGFVFDYLVFVHGYDMPLADVRRAAAMERSLRAVAAAVGARGIVVRTNLREHPTFAVTEWLRSHGGALAAVGHLLTDTVGTLVISSSYPYCYDHPWGTHWTTDPLWSSSRLEVVHYGAEHWRTEKLHMIVGEDLVRRHLRVCYKNLSPEGNCGRCEKCVRTMLILAEVGQLEGFPALGGSAGLIEGIKRVWALRPDLMPVYESLMRNSQDPQVVAALQALIARTRSRSLRLARYAKGLVRSTVYCTQRQIRKWGILR